MIEKDLQETSNSYHQLLGYLGHLALEGVKLSDLYRSTSELLVRELKLASCEFWEVLADRDTLKIVSRTTRHRHEDTELGISERSLSEFLRQTQGSKATSVDSRHHRLLFPINPQQVGLIIPGTSYPAGVAILNGQSSNLNNPREVALLQEVANLLASAVERKRSEMLLLTQTNVLQAIASGSELSQTLFFLCSLLEQQNAGAFCSILLLDAEKQQLQSGVAPSLPKAYAEALNGLIIGDCAGSCGTAAYRGESVFVHDIKIDPLWAPFRDLALGHNIRSCWSIPFLSQAGDVLGTFALSFKIPCQPTAEHLRVMETAAHLASIATERSQVTQKLTRLALYDNLTGLVNRSFFTDYLSSRLKRQRSLKSANCDINGYSFAVLFFDLDRFKLVNDSFGHIAGDHLLKAFAKRIEPHLGPDDVFARLGGDEFAILLENVNNESTIKAFSKALLKDLEGSFYVEASEIFVSTSIGIVHAVGQYQSPQELLRDADIAMYEAKNKYQGGGYMFFNEYMHAIARSRLQLELELRHTIDALNKGTAEAFTLVYQPIMSLETEQLVGFEVLLRWIHPDRGMISPDEFISVLEETGLILTLGDWVLETACSQLREWRRQYASARDLTISVNVSGKQFLQPSLVRKVADILSETEIPASALRLEVTESILIETAATVHDCFRRLKALGLRISLDDFGTGYSSLSYLRDFPVDILKIDRSFITELEQGKNSIVQAMINLGHNLGMKIVAEGVENELQLAKLIDLECDFCQGYLLSRPLSTQKVSELLQLHEKRQANLMTET